MSAARRDLPEPDLDGTDPDQVLRSRLFSTQVGNAPDASTPAHTQPTSHVRTGMGSGTRPDPKGMKRTSLYVTEAAASALEQAADQILDSLGRDIPRHVALSALLEAAARQAPAIAHDLARQRAAELAARLQELPTPDNDAE